MRLCLVVTLLVLAGCGAAPEGEAPVAVEAALPPVERMRHECQ